MDCCHSGTNSRFAPIDRSDARGSERRRFLQLTPQLEEAHRRYRARVGSPPPTTPEESLPGVIHFAACLDNQFASESSGQGHFTRVATADLAAAVSRGATNETFGNDVTAKVIGLGRPQTPRLMRLPADQPTVRCSRDRRATHPRRALIATGPWQSGACSSSKQVRRIGGSARAADMAKPPFRLGEGITTPAGPFPCISANRKSPCIAC